MRGERFSKNTHTEYIHVHVCVYVRMCVRMCMCVCRFADCPPSPSRNKALQITINSVPMAPVREGGHLRTTNPQSTPQKLRTHAAPSNHVEPPVSRAHLWLCVCMHHTHTYTYTSPPPTHPSSSFYAHKEREGRGRWPLHPGRHTDRQRDLHHWSLLPHTHTPPKRPPPPQTGGQALTHHPPPSARSSPSPSPSLPPPLPHWPPPTRA
mmetsp:Transcript_45565/g.128636  ORF Transcript_45565/g.128636 Transcript_45565/m.128636 type:complete len:208 (-) Transcript_45565:638-1261(-)